MYLLKKYLFRYLMFLKIEGSSSATIMDEASAEKKSTVKFTSLHRNLTLR